MLSACSYVYADKFTACVQNVQVYTFLYQLSGHWWIKIFKSVVTVTRFTIDYKHLIKSMWVKKNYVEKRLLKMFLTKDEVLMR